ncbi:MAG: hypothetical protein AB200_02515 [Parcubacteria bacterium C7867-005]|nr:MAG: hypothetical protein AB200_02515 [Parcubacteria bacterium C7867-005]
MIYKKQKQSGYFLIQTLVFGAIAVVIIGGLISFAIANSRLARRSILSEQAFQTAEAGIEYYRWHLAHAPTDYTNGTGGAGPYVKNFYDKNNVLIGTFSLAITPPDLGSTLVNIVSTGVSAVDSNISRKITVRLAIPSFANFATVSTSALRFGEGTEVYGPIHSNAGIRFDGLAHNLVTSSVANYNDADHTGNNEFGVHTHVNPPPGSGINDTFRALEAPPSAVPVRTDVFIAGRSFPAPVVDFSVINSDLTQMKVDAQASGLYFATSTVSGYRVVLKTDNTFDVYRVNSLVAPGACTGSGTGWGTWSVNVSTLMGNYAIPANGLVYFEDHVWVEGIVDGSRITIIAANLPDTNSALRRSITINNDLLYTNYDGQDVVALIAQNNVNVGLISEDDIRIDAALVAQVGRVGRFSYNSNCSPYHIRSTLTLYGTIVTAQRYGFAYVGGLGYQIRNLIYDAYLLYTPPPSFPETSDFYEVIYWKESE